MEKKFKGKFTSFFKKNIYLILMILCLVAIITMITYTVVKNGKGEEGGGSLVQAPNNSEQSDGNTTPDTNGDIKDNENQGDQKVDVVPSVIGAPLNSLELIKAYTDTSLVYNSTMKHWSTHQGIDYKASVGDEVKAVLDGEVIAVSTTTLRGTTVKIKHQGGITSSYSLLSPDVRVKVGDVVKQGDVIGIIGTEGVFEASDGAHLHFELMKDDKLVDPDFYMQEGNK